MIYELRIYTMYSGRMDAINQRFANHTMGIFEKHGMKVCDFWEDIQGEPKLYYVMEFEDMNTRNHKWEVFANDPEWIEVKGKSEEDGPIVEKVEAFFMKRVDYVKDIKY